MGDSNVQRFKNVKIQFFKQLPRKCALFPLDDGNMVCGICSGSGYLCSATFCAIILIIFFYLSFVGQKLVTVSDDSAVRIAN